MIPPVIVPVTFKEIAIAIKEIAIGSKDIIANFEKDISSYNNCKHSILTYSGRTALYTLLKAYNIKKDDEIILPSFMCETVSQMLLDMGLKLNFVDINPNTYNIDINDLNKRISKNTKAILAVHMFGIPCDMKAIMEIAHNNKSIVIEDAAQAMGAEYMGKKVGSIADAGFCSFGRGKPITAMGGGVILTNDQIIAKKCQEIIGNFKQKPSNILTLIQLMGYSSLRNRMFYDIVNKKVRSEEFRKNLNLDNIKYKFTAIQASIGISQLQNLEEFNNKRQYNAYSLENELKKIGGIRLPIIINHSRPIFLRFPIQVTDTIKRNRLMNQLEKIGIQASIVYPVPLPYLYNNIASGYYGAEEVTKKIIALPTHPMVKNEDIDNIVQVIKSDLNES